MALSTDAWISWKQFTTARIALGRAGGSLPTREWLEFSLAHGRAQDSVHLAFNVSSITEQITAAGEQSICVKSSANNRATYLQYPDRGRSLCLNDAQRLQELRKTLISENESFDLVIIIGDGLSAPAAEQHAVSLMKELLPRLRKAGWSIAPIVISEQTRVALQDEIGFAMRARLSLIFLGERPGLSSPDSLGAYLTYDPRPGRHDAERNCVSNIRPDGLTILHAADTLEYLLINAKQRRLSGIALKDERSKELLASNQSSLIANPPLL